jgi:hypothetical protein
LKALMDGQGEEGNLRSALVRLAGGLIIEEGLDGEVTDALGQIPRAFGERAVPSRSLWYRSRRADF